MKTLLKYILVSVLFVISTQVKAEDGIVSRITAGIVAKVESVVHQNELNTALGRPDLNNYIIRIDAMDIDSLNDKFLFQRIASGKEKYLGDFNELTLNKQLVQTFYRTEVSPYLLIINNMPVRFSERLPDGVTAKSIINGSKGTDRMQAAGEAAKKQAAVLGEKIRNAVQSRLKYGMFVCWTKYVAIFNGKADGALIELYNTTLVGMQDYMKETFSDHLKQQSFPSDESARFTRAQSFVNAMIYSVDAYVSDSYPIEGPGLDFYLKYENAGVDKKLLARIGNRINKLGRDVYNQYQEDINYATGISSEVKDFQEYFDALLKYEEARKSWVEKLQGENDSERMLLKLVMAKDKDGWYKSLTGEDRVRFIKILNKDNLISINNWLANFVNMRGVGGEQIIVKLVSTTNGEYNERLVLDELKKNKLLQRLVTKIDGDEFGAFIEALVRLIEDIYPKDNNKDLAEAIEKQRYLPFDGSFFGPANTKDFNDQGSLDMSVRTKMFDSQMDYVFTADVYDYVLVEFKSFFTVGGKQYEKGDKFKVPAIFCYYLINEYHNKQLFTSAKIVFDLATMAIGVGQLTAALEAANTVKAVWAVVDLGIGTFNLVTDPYDDILKAKYPGFYEVKTAANLAYAVSRPVAEIQMAMNEAITSGDKIVRDAEVTAEEVRIMKEELRALRKKAGLPEDVPEEIPKKPIPESLLAEREAELRQKYGAIYDHEDFQEFRQLLMDDIYIEVVPLDAKADEALNLARTKGQVAKKRNIGIGKCGNNEYCIASSYRYTAEMSKAKSGFTPFKIIEDLGEENRLFDVIYENRYYDSETLILELEARSRGAVKGAVYPDVKGEMYIISDLCPCPSCTNVIRQYRKMYPHEKFKISCRLRVHLKQ